MRLALKCSWQTQYHVIDENWSSFSQDLSIDNIYLTNGRTISSSTLKFYPIWACVHLLNSFTVSVSLMYICHAVLGKCWFLEIIHYRWLLEYFCLLFHTDPWALWGEVQHRHPGQSLAFQTLLLTLCWQVLGFLVSYTQLQEEVFLMRVEWCTILWI